jgi:hypothetical protein
MPVAIEGARELRASLKAVDRGLGRELARIHKKVAAPLAEAVASRAPVRSGRLAGSIRALGSQRAAQVAAGSARAVPYAGPINYGWPARNIPAAYFLEAGLEAEDQATLDRYQAEVDALIDDVWQAG